MSIYIIDDDDDVDVGVDVDVDDNEYSYIFFLLFFYVKMCGYFFCCLHKLLLQFFYI